MSVGVCRGLWMSIGVCGCLWMSGDVCGCLSVDVCRCERGVWGLTFDPRPTLGPCRGTL